MILLALVLLLSRDRTTQEHAIYKSVDRGISWTKTGAILAAMPALTASAKLRTDLCRYRCGHLFVG